VHHSVTAISAPLKRNDIAAPISGQPQALSDPAVRTTATFFVFVYALLLLALEACHLAHSLLPCPRWRRRRAQQPQQRITTPQVLSLLPAGLWASALRLEKTALLHMLARQQRRS
jgi:hypothetical protein